MQVLKHFKDNQAHTFNDLIELTGLPSIELSLSLDAWVEKKRIEKKGSLYQLKPNYKIGQLEIKNQGFAFLLQTGEDLYIAEEDLGYSLDGDLVLVHVGKKNKVIDVIQRSLKQIVVHVKKVKESLYFLPIKPFRLSIELDTNEPLLGGEVLLIEFESFTGKKAIAKIVEKIGHETDPGIDILELVYQANWPYAFKEETLKEAEHITSIDTKPRREVTDELIVTIDGKDAKDFDDAVSLKKEGTDYILAVHIADVSSYVKPNSFLDQEAFERTTSVYLADRVIPMLPRKLSNDLCSLNADTKKKCL